MDRGRETVELALRQVDHRPRPMPSRPWLMRMRWHDLLFAHWPVDAALAARAPLRVG